MVRWTDINESPYPREQNALDYLRSHLPGDEPYRAWGPFQFKGADRWHEVDCLVVASKAIFLLEIKSWRGDLTGGGTEWELPRGRESNPIRLATEKARSFKGRLMETPAMKQQSSGRRSPWVEPLVFFSEEEFTCRLKNEFRAGLTGIDRTKQPDTRQGGGLPGVVETIRGFPGRGSINRDLSTAINKAMSQLDVKPSGRFRAIGEFEIELHRVLSDGPDGRVHAGRWERDAEDRSGTCRITFGKPLPTADGPSLLRAERAALREYDLLFPVEVQHDGIVRVGAIDPSHPWGPAVVHRISADAKSLDEFMESEGAELDMAERLRLFGRLIDALSHAHSRGLRHRSLRPSVIHVLKSPDGHWQPVIDGWHTGLRTEQSDDPVAGTTHDSVFEVGALRYVAPEATRAELADPEQMDVFALGTIGYLILTGEEPPEDVTGYLATDGYLALDTDTLGIKSDFGVVIEEATKADPATRPPAALLRDYFVDAEIGSPQASEGAAPTGRGSIPNDATAQEAPEGSEGGFETFRRLGTGAAATAFLARDASGRVGVLKVANTEGLNETIRVEGETLGRLRSRSIVALMDGPLDLDGRTAVFIEHADKGTLRHVISTGEEVDLSVMSMWGTDLLGALEEMEQADVLHRDIKPENIGLTAGASRDRLLLFDFSLASASREALSLGTLAYADPFLGHGGRHLHDFQAERYSAAVVLHEMLTGARPMWGQGNSDPALTGSDLKIATDCFPGGAAEDLRGFFERAMDPAVDNRFASAKEMARAWEDALEIVFQSAGDGADTGEDPESTDDDREDQEAGRGKGAVATGAAAAIAAGAAMAPMVPPALVVAGTGALLSVAFRKMRTRVTEEEQAAADQALESIPEEDRIFDSARRLWKIQPTPESIAAIQELVNQPTVELRESASELLEADGAGNSPPQAVGSISPPDAVEVGDYRIEASPRSESFVGTTVSNIPGVKGERLLYQVDGPEGLGLVVSDERFENGERHVQLLDAVEAPVGMEQIEKRLRLGVTDRNGECAMKLDIARRKDSSPDTRPTTHKTSIDELSDLSGLDVEDLLRRHGATRLGTKVELFGESEGLDTQKNRLFATFPEEAALLPVVAFVVTRVIPTHRDLAGD